LLKQLLPITELLLQLDNSPSIHDYFDEVCQRFIDANGYSVKGRNMLTSRMAKLKKVVSDSNPKRVMADLSPHDIPRIKRELPKALARQKRSKSQGENIQTYYQLFNRVMVEALNDSFISRPLKLSNPATKKADNTRPFSTDEISSLLQGWPYSLNDEEQARKLVRDAHAYRFWLLPLGLFTGARLNELCQLRVHDIRRDGHGINVMSVNDNGNNKSLKNEQSRREIPICSALVDMGFMAFVEERRAASGNDAQLFAELTFTSEHLYSRMASRFFCGHATGKGYIGSRCARASDGKLSPELCTATPSLRRLREHHRAFAGASTQHLRGYTETLPRQALQPGVAGGHRARPQIWRPAVTCEMGKLQAAHASPERASPTRETSKGGLTCSPHLALLRPQDGYRF
jgi:site-specific recombinase XerD